MSKADKKQTAKDELMHALMSAFYKEDLDEETRELMHKQVNRIEKLFGYELNSWNS